MFSETRCVTAMSGLAYSHVAMANGLRLESATTEECNRVRHDIDMAKDRWEGLEDAFNELTDTATPIGGCEKAFFQPVSERLMMSTAPTTMESSSNFSLVCRLIAGVTPPEELGARARALLEFYKDVRGLVQAAGRDIKHGEILTEMERSFLRTVRDLSTGFLRECSMRNPQVKCFSDLHKYLRTTLATELAEVTRLIMLDVQYNIIADELHGIGKLNETPLFPKEVVARAVAHDAAALIIVHSHPSGEPEPTKGDIKLTRRLAFVLEELGVALHDHVIVGRRAVVSLRRCGVLGDEGGSYERS